jgi:hypothetical protein
MSWRCRIRFQIRKQLHAIMVQAMENGGRYNHTLRKTTIIQEKREFAFQDMIYFSGLAKSTPIPASFL